MQTDDIVRFRTLDKAQWRFFRAFSLVGVSGGAG